jgi:hypothetical protein
MITKLDVAVGLTVGSDETTIKKVFAGEQVDPSLRPYYCFSEKKVVLVGDKHYQVDYSVVVKEIE